MNNDNYSLLNDLYLCVSATKPKNTDNLLIFLDKQMDIELRKMNSQSGS